MGDIPSSRPSRLGLLDAPLTIATDGTVLANVTHVLAKIGSHPQELLAAALASGRKVFLGVVLTAARADNSYDRKLLRLTSPDLLIIDDLGLRPLTDDEPLDLYEIIRARYERASTVVTSNRAVPELDPLFGDPLLASAALDRFSTTPRSSPSRATHSATHRRQNGAGASPTTRRAQRFSTRSRA